MHRGQSARKEEQTSHCDQQSGRKNAHLAHATLGGTKSQVGRHGSIRGNGMSIRQ
jgi:hypothetical protein